MLFKNEPEMTIQCPTRTNAVGLGRWDGPERWTLLQLCTWGWSVGNNVGGSLWAEELQQLPLDVARPTHNHRQRPKMMSKSLQTGGSAWSRASLSLGKGAAPPAYACCYQAILTNHHFWNILWEFLVYTSALSNCLVWLMCFLPGTF